MTQDQITQTQQTVASLLPEAEQLLCEMIRHPSTPGQEHELMLLLEQRFADIPGVEVQRVDMSNALRDDPDYSDPVPDIEYDGRFNLHVIRRGTGGGRTLLFNTHIDVVPASEGQEDAFNPRVEEGIVYGRGACDDKGQTATLHLLLRTLAAMDIQTSGDIIGHIVVEEENGGNGTLAMVRAGESADGCIVMEPSDNRLLTSIRGAVWFRVVFTGKAGHSGQAGVTRSALLMARDAIDALEQYHANLLKASRGLELFDEYDNPMPITFGKLRSGNWPAAAPSHAELEGVLGLLPNKTKEQVMAEMEAALNAVPTLAGNFDLSFMYRHDSSVISPEHPLPQAMLAAAHQSDAPLKVDAMTASCDAWLYNNQIDIPTVVYGAGTLKVAHSRDEHIAMDDIARSATLLTNLVRDFCGAKT